MSQLLTLTNSQTSITSHPNSLKPPTSYNSLPGSRRYEFARGFLPSTITILSGSQAIYQLSESDTWYTSRNSKSPSHVILRKATGNRETLATFHPRLFWSDVIEVRVPGGGKVETLRLREFLKTYYVTQDTGPSVEMRMRIPDSYSLGLPDGSSLLWRLSPNSRLMTMKKLYSAIGSGKDACSTLLAHASLSQTYKLTNIELALPKINQTLLIYIFIAASMIESRLSKQKCEEQEQAHQTLDLTKIKTPKWMIIPLGLGITTFTTQ